MKASKTSSEMLSGLDDETVNRIRTVFQRHPEIRMVKLYGSRAKGNFTPGSDVDLALIGEELERELLNRIATELDDLLLPYSFDLSLSATISNPELIAHIERVGKVFYRRSC